MSVSKVKADPSLEARGFGFFKFPSLSFSLWYCHWSSSSRVQISFIYGNVSRYKGLSSESHIHAAGTLRYSSSGSTTLWLVTWAVCYLSARLVEHYCFLPSVVCIELNKNRHWSSVSIVSAWLIFSLFSVWQKWPRWGWWCGGKFDVNATTPCAWCDSTIGLVALSSYFKRTSDKGLRTCKIAAWRNIPVWTLRMTTNLNFYGFINKWMVRLWIRESVVFPDFSEE